MTTTKRIVASTIALLTLLPVMSAQASTPPIGPVKHQPLEYVLPPAGSMFYDIIKKNAEDVQYPTRENDDLTYPGPRTP